MFRRLENSFGTCIFGSRGGIRWSLRGEGGVEMNYDNVVLNNIIVSLTVKIRSTLIVLGGNGAWKRGLIDEYRFKAVGHELDTSRVERVFVSLIRNAEKYRIDRQAN